jgi:hypothetical protein
MSELTRQENGGQKLARLDEYGEEQILEELASGVLTTDLIRRMGVGWKVWAKWMRASAGREQRVEDARRQASHFFASRAVNTAQEADVGSVKVARLQVDTDKWIASRLNRDDYDTRPSGVNVQLNVGDLHAQAMALINSGSAGAVVDDIHSDDWRDEEDEDEDAGAVEPSDLVDAFSGARLRD